MPACRLIGLAALLGVLCCVAVRDPVDCGHRVDSDCRGASLLQGASASTLRTETAAPSPTGPTPEAAPQRTEVASGGISAAAIVPAAPAAAGPAERAEEPTLQARLAALPWDRICLVGAAVVIACTGLVIGCGSLRGSTSPADAGAGGAAKEDASSTAAPAAPVSHVDNKEASVSAVDQELADLKKKKHQVLMEQALNRKKLEKILEAILAHEAKLHAKPPPSAEDIQHRVEEAIAATDMMAERKLLSGLAYVAPLFMQGQRVMTALQKRAQEAQEQAAKLALEQTKHLCTDLEVIFDVDSIRSSMFRTLGGIEAPSMATLLASAFAPAQLRLLAFTNKINAVQGGLFVAVSLLVLGLDWHGPCPAQPDADGQPGAEVPESRLLRIWFLLDLAVGGSCFLIRLWVQRRVSTLLEDLEEPPPLLAVEDHIAALRMLLDYYMTTGCEALVRLDQILSSYLYSLANWALVFNYGLLSFGVDIVFNTTWTSCRSLALAVIRTRTIFFLILLLPNLVYLVLFFVWRFLESESFQISVMSAADSVDEVLGLGVPLAGVVAQAVMIRNKRDMVQLQLRMYELRKSQLKTQQAEAEAALRRLEASQDRADREIQRLRAQWDHEASLTEKQQLEEQAHAKDEILKGAEQVFRQINARAMEVTKQAEEQVEKWEHGEGPEFLQAMSRGEGLHMLTQFISEVDVSEVARGALNNTQELVEGLKDQEWVQQALAKGSDLATNLQEQEWVQQAMVQGADLAQAASARVQELSQDDRVQQMLAQGRTAVQEMAQSEGLQQALAQGQSAVLDLAHSEQVQQALSQGQAVIHRLATSEQLQQPEVVTVGSTVEPPSATDGAGGKKSGAHAPAAPVT